jgi:uncharacterized protein involved in outer membrane biogenesis
MKKVVKKILKWTGISLLVIILLLILIPIIFKDEIKQMVIDEVNTNLNAKLSIDDFDLTFISTFPNMTVEIHDARLTGIKEFKGVELMKIKTLTAHVGFWSVIGGDQIEIDEIHIDEPIIDVRVLENGLANYDIVKPDTEKTKEEIEEPSSFKLSLKEYTITNARIKYDDRASDMFAELINVNHTGTGDLTADVVDFETTTTMDKLTYRMDGLSYLTDVKTDANINLLMKFTEKSSKFTLKKNTIALNNVDLSLDGYYEMFEGYDDMDLKLDASKSSFKDFLSLIPTFYHSGYESMVSSGSMTLNGLIKGKMDSTNMPGWDFGVKLKDGSIKYPGLSKITNVQVDASSKFPGGEDLDDMTFDMPKFHANLSKNTIDGSLYMKKIMSDPYIQSSINSHVDLATIKDFIPMENGEEYTGILDADVDIKGKMSALDAEDYEKFTAEGTVELSEMNYKSEELSEDVDINHLKLTFSPENLALNELDAKMGKSDFQMDGEVRNYFGYMLRDDVLAGDFNLNSDYIDLDELMGIYPEEEAAPVDGRGERAGATVEPEPSLVPENIDFNMSTNIKKARYSGIDAKDITGKLVLKDEVAELSNFDMKAMGGDIGLTGNYNTQDHENPKFDFGYKLKGINIEDLTKNFLTVEKLAPIAKFAKGKISSNFDMSSDLTSGLMPVMNSISSDGDVSSNKLQVTGFELLNKIEKVTKFKDLSNQTFKNFATHFSIHDGKVMLTPFDLKLGGINTKVSGYTTLEKDMNYKFAMNVPKAKIPTSILKEVEKGLTTLNGLHPAIKMGDLPAFIPVNVFASGDPKNPTITTDLKEQVSKAAKAQIGNLIEEIKTVVKDSVTAIIDDKVDDIKEEIEKQKKAILADAQKKANEAKAFAKKGADKIRTEADAHGKKLIKEAGSNPIKKKLAQVAAKKYTEEAEKKAVALEKEGDNKADAIMKKANEQADKLG